MVSLRGLTLTAARPRIIVPLFARDPAALCPLAKAASADPAAELVELRLDPLPADEFLNALALVRGIVDKPLVVTIRTRAEGGELALTPDAYAAHCRALLARGGVDVLDIEWRACGAFRAELRDAAHAAGAAARAAPGFVHPGKAAVFCPNGCVIRIQRCGDLFVGTPFHSASSCAKSARSSRWGGRSSEMRPHLQARNSSTSMMAQRSVFTSPPRTSSPRLRPMASSSS